MRKLIFILSVATFGFAGWTFWNDPTVGPKIRSVLPEKFDTASIGASIRDAAAGIAPSLVTADNTGGGGGPTGQWGGIGAASHVTGGVKAAVGAGN